VERQFKERLVGAAVLVAAAVILIPEMLSGSGQARRAETSSSETRSGRSDAPMKTYTIDLNQPPGSPVQEARAPLSDESAMSAAQAGEAGTTLRASPAGASDGDADQRSSATASSPVSARSPAAAAPASAAPAPGGSAGESHAGVRNESHVEGRNDSSTEAPPAHRPGSAAPATSTAAPEKPAVTPASRPADPPSSVASAAGPSGAGWAVQVGSYSKQATAQQLVAQLRAHGDGAFIMPIQSRGATLYRVRVGPMKDRAGAEATLKRLKASSTSMSGAAVVKHP